LNYDGENLGILDVDSREASAFSDDDLQILRSVAKQFSVEMMEIKVGLEREKILKERENMLREKEQAFNEIAHEMKTPLIGVKDLSLNIVDFKVDKIELDQNLLLIANEADKALNFTNQILDLAYLEHGRKPFRFELNPIDVIAQRAIERNIIFAETKKIKIDYDRSNENLLAHVDEENLLNPTSPHKIKKRIKTERNWV
jgi:signal transduction histidine kinase